MQDNYFSTCTGKAKQGSDMPAFGENNYFNCESDYNVYAFKEFDLKVRGKMQIQCSSILI